ncbi:MAG: M20/M25/M40 family metallo-hydrolase [bacterium]|nr:M20/M25/M40 family metallo-hydrolase [bacterium]
MQKRKSKPKSPVDLVTEMLAIPGKSCEEAAIADFIEGELLKAGAPKESISRDNAHLKTPTRGETGNLYLRLKGTTRGPRRLLTAHMDTVPLCAGAQPMREGNMIRSKDPTTALGADDRAGCAVLLSTALHLLRDKPDHPPLTFCWFVQEEIGLQGARCMKKSELGKPKLAFNWDGGAANKITIGATGGYRLAITIRGIASHAGGAPEWGVSAITIASKAIAELHENGWLGAVVKGKQTGTSNVGVIEGGAATNVVTDLVQVRAEARSHSPKFRKRIVDEIEKAFQRAALQVQNVAGACGGIEFSGRLDYESFKLPKSSPSVLVAKQAILQLGEKPETAIANGGLDANWLTAHGIETVTLGCGQIGQHTVAERLDIEQFENACNIALLLATGSEETGQLGNRRQSA